MCRVPCMSSQKSKRINGIDKYFIIGFEWKVVSKCMEATIQGMGKADIRDECKDKRMIILYVVPNSLTLWPMINKEKRYFYNRHLNNNDRWTRFNLFFMRVVTSFPLETILGLKCKINIIIYLGDGQVPWELAMDFLCLAAYLVPVKLTLIYIYYVRIVYLIR